MRQSLDGRIAHGCVGIAFPVALQFDKSDIHGPGRPIVLSLPIHRVIGKQRIGGSLFQPAPRLREVCATVIVITQSQRGPSADRGAFFSFRELHQPLVGHSNGVLVQIARQSFELLSLQANYATGGLVGIADGFFFLTAVRFWGAACCARGLAMLTLEKQKNSALDKRIARSAEAHGIFPAGRAERQTHFRLRVPEVERISAAALERDMDIRRVRLGRLRPGFQPSSHRSNRRDGPGSTENAGHILYVLSQYHLANAGKCLYVRAPNERHWDGAF